MRKVVLSENRKKALWNGASEALEEWTESLAIHDKYSYHPLFEIIDTFFNCMIRDRACTKDNRGDNRTRVEFLLRLLNDPQAKIDAIGTPASPEDNLREEVEQVQKKCQEKFRSGGYLLPLDDYKTAGMIVTHDLSEQAAEEILARCTQIRLCKNGFEAFEVAERTGDLLRGCIDVFTFSLLLHLLRPDLFPYWGAGYIFERINVSLAHDYSEFEFPEHFPFDHFSAYLENCFLLYCSKHDLILRIGYIPFTYAANLLAPSDLG